MFENLVIELTEDQALVYGMKVKQQTMRGRVLTYAEKSGEVIFCAEDDLQEFSLDMLYKCLIKDIQDGYTGLGRIKERFRSKDGKLVVFTLQKGLYKINIKS